MCVRCRSCKRRSLSEQHASFKYGLYAWIFADVSTIWSDYFGQTVVVVAPMALPGCYSLYHYNRMRWSWPSSAFACPKNPRDVGSARPLAHPRTTGHANALGSLTFQLLSCSSLSAAVWACLHAESPSQHDCLLCKAWHHSSVRGLFSWTERTRTAAPSAGKSAHLAGLQTLTSCAPLTQTSYLDLGD